MNMLDDKIEAIAAEYRDKGYAVTVHPAPADLPPFLAPFEPEIVAVSAGGSVVMKVMPATKFDADLARELMYAVEHRPGWKFELSLVSPPLAPDIPAEEELAGDEQVSRLLHNAEVLFLEDQKEAAALLAWSALETILRRRARSNAPLIERQSSARVLKHLYSLGLIPPDIYDNLWKLLEFRNAVAHGFEPRNAVPSIPEIVSDIRNLQAAA